MTLSLSLSNRALSAPQLAEILISKISIMKKSLLSVFFLLLSTIVSAQTITLKSSMPKDEALRLSIAARGGSVKIGTGNGTTSVYSVSENLETPTFLPLKATANKPTITIEGDVLGLECSSLKLSSIDCSQAASLTVLKCDINELSSLDVSKNTKLKRLYCNDNELTALNYGGGAELLLLYCQENQLSSLDLSQATHLTELACYRNQLKSIDVSHCPNLKVLNCSRNKITKLDVSKLSQLKMLYCEQCKLDELDVTNNPLLTHLYCGDNKLKVLDVSKQTALEELNCKLNELSTLDLSQNTALEELYCFSNQLKELSVAHLENLMTLSCGDNQLQTLDLSHNAALKEASLSYNKLTALTIAGNASLHSLACDHNQISELSATGCSGLRALLMDHNNLSGDASLRLIQSLPEVDEGYLMLFNHAEDPTPDMNCITDEGLRQATAKKWYVLNGEELVKTGIGNIQFSKETNQPVIASDGRSVNFTGGSTHWMLYATNGMLLQEGFGTSVRFPSLPKGVYILSYGQFSKKFIMK